VPQIASYRIYRAESQPTPGTVKPAPSATTSPSATSVAEAAKLTSPFVKIGETETATYLDTQFELGKTYVYTVRSVVRYGADQIESADSNSFVVLARDVSPPATPRGLIAVYVPAQGNLPAHLELSWSISPETDLAGYNVYRSEQASLLGTRANNELLLTPAFRDMNAAPGRNYFYSVTAVDRSGNESPASAAAPGTVPAESQPTP
jgi:fibronectin type 3 domain-containing protein